MGWPSWLASIPMAGALAGLAVALCLIARRGRRVDAAPLCRGCRYDLLPGGGPGCGSELATVDRLVLPMRCPECGRDVRSEGDLRVGHRRPLRSVYVASGVVGVAALLIAAVALSPYITAGGMQRLKPLWLLQREATEREGPAAGAAATEIERRAKAQELSEEELEGLVGPLLAAQVGNPGAWQWSQDSLVLLLRSEGLVDDEQWASYGVERMRFEAMPRSRFRVGNPLAITSWLGAHHATRMNQAALKEGFTVFDSTGTQLASFPAGLGGVRMIPGAFQGPTNDTVLDVDLPVGVHTLTLESKWGAGFVTPGVPGVQQQTFRTRREVIRVEVVPRDVATCQLVDDEATALAMAGMTIKYVAEREFTGLPPMAIVEVSRPEAALTLAVEAYLIVGERSYGPCYRVLRPGGRGDSALVFENIEPLGASTARVELHSTVDAAERTGDLVRVWSGSIVFDGVPVARNMVLDAEGNPPPLPAAQVIGGGMP